MIDQKEYQQSNRNRPIKIEKIINSFLLFGIIILSLLLFFKIIIHPISGDDWIYGSSYPLNKLFF